jgi:multidrug efflux pump subunit AcrA (membrane-fusion protein)
MKPLLLILLIACAKPAGGPLAHTFDNTRLASVALDAKQAVAQAQQQHDLALQQHDKADDAYRDSEIEQEVAEYQAERAVLVTQLVGTRLNDKPQTSSEIAALARRTAGAKVEFMRARREWLRLLSSSTFYAVYATQAKLELERARLAQSTGLTPAGFDLASFQQQLDQRDRAARAAADETEKERQAAGAKLTAWNELERAFIQTSGMKGPSESERAVGEWKQTTPVATGL